MKTYQIIIVALVVTVLGALTLPYPFNIVWGGVVGFALGLWDARVNGSWR